MSTDLSGSTVSAEAGATVDELAALRFARVGFVFVNPFFLVAVNGGTA